MEKRNAFVTKFRSAFKKKPKKQFRTIRIPANGLTEEDYKNIWLRHKNQTIAWIFFVFTISVAIISFFGYAWTSSYIKTKIDRGVKDYVNSEDFQTTVLNDFQKRYVEIDRRFDSIDQRFLAAEYFIKGLEVFKNIPFLLDSSGFTLVDSLGNAWRAEIGTNSIDNPIYFKSRFKDNPFVQISSVDEIGFIPEDDSPYNYFRRVRRTPIISVNYVTPSFFEVHRVRTFRADGTSKGDYEVTWIAIGRIK